MVNTRRVQPLVVIGCGGFGRGLAAVVEAINAEQPRFELIGHLDDAPTPENLERLAAWDLPLLGGQDWLDNAPADVGHVIGIGNAGVRRQIDTRFGHRPSPVLVHPHASVANDAELGPGTVLCAGVRVSVNVQMGRHVHLNMNVTVGHDVTLGDYTTAYPLVSISGSVTTADGVTFGTNSTILQGLSVGGGAMLGAGACVVADVPPDRVVKGIPAR